MNLLNILRTLFRIRVKRGLPPPGPLPQVGSSIVLNNLRIKLKHPISNEQWSWFSKQGWRVVDMRLNRRKYICVPDGSLEQVLNADKADRDELYQRLVIAGGEKCNASSNLAQQDNPN